MAVDLSQYDPIQQELMDEMCILTDLNDAPVGAASKKTCHLMANINQGMLHRAFSVFLFNSDNQLLLQQRADEKITFPGYWTNTCCSHPLMKADEMDGEPGVRVAARRKLQHELGIVVSDIALESFQFMTKIHYKAPSDDVWGEHEVDYILLLKQNVALDVNPNEVQAVRYCSRAEVRSLLETADENSLKITPWFKLICNKFLFKWWEHLDTPDFGEQTVIHHL